MSDYDGPAYEGRALPRPQDEITDQGLDFDLTTLMGRRRVLRAMGLGATAIGGVALGTMVVGSRSPAAAATSASGLIAIPQETAGPYPGDGSNGVEVLTQSGIVRSDIRSSFGGATATAPGVPITLKLTVLNLAGAPVSGAAVYVWHCNRDGNYSLYTTGLTGENYLRGVQVTDANGQVSFTSIFPACYSGRWPHIHFEVYPNLASITSAANAIATSQIAMPKTTCDTVYAQTGYSASVTNLSHITLATDNVFGNDSAVHQLPAVGGDVSHGLTLALTAPVNADSTAATTATAIPTTTTSTTTARPTPTPTTTTAVPQPGRPRHGRHFPRRSR